MRLHSGSTICFHFGTTMRFHFCTTDFALLFSNH
jgi:hypothetical protein